MSSDDALLDRLQSFVSENKRGVLIGAAAAAAVIAIGGVAYYNRAAGGDDEESLKSDKRKDKKKQKKQKKSVKKEGEASPSTVIPVKEVCHSSFGHVLCVLMYDPVVMHILLIKMVVCITLMQMPGVSTSFLKKKKKEKWIQ